MEYKIKKRYQIYRYEQKKEFDTMTVLRNTYMTFLSALMVVLVASCASTDRLAPLEENNERRVTVTGSRIAKSEVEDTQRRDRTLQRESMMLMLGAADDKLKKDSAVDKIVSWKPSTQANNNAVIKLGGDEKIKPEAMEVSVQIDGFRARIVIDGFYTNPHNRNLEGSFKFRLPDGAVPYFFAFGETVTTLDDDLKSPISFDSSSKPLSRLSPLSIMQHRASRWLAPKEAIMVSKEKAAFAYNQTVARQVDPALLEWAGAGIFSAKVFPLQARKTHRVVIGYDLDLKRVGGDLFLDLPFTKEAINKRVNLVINKKGASEITLNRIVADELKNELIISKNNELVQQSIEGTLLNGVRVTIKQHANVTLVGDDEAGSFFAKQWKVDLPTESSTRSIESSTQITGSSTSYPRAVFAIDTSLSASAEKFHQWVALMEKILTNNENELKEFALLSFNTDAHWWQKQFVKNSARQRTRLLKYLNSLILEGATDLSGALKQSADPDWLTDNGNPNSDNSSYDLFLLSDGAITWGEKDPYFISESLKNTSVEKRTVKQLYTYRLGLSGENSSLLNHLTREIGGASYLLTDDSDLDSLSRAHKMVPWRIDSIESEGAEDILLRGRPKSVYPGQVLTIAGRFSEQMADKIRIKFVRGEQSKTIDISTKTKIDSTIASRVYGQIAVSQIESVAALERKVASAYANHFRVPGKSSSLLMLESKADYQRYNIQPAQDAYVVKLKQVKALYAALSDGFAQTLSDPKLRLTEQLDKMQKMSYLRFKLPDAVSLLIDSLPRTAFELDAQSKFSQKIKRTHIPKKYLNKLTPELIKYDFVQTEAERRFKKYSAADGLKVLSSLIEQMPSDVAIIRDVAFAAESWGLYQQAYALHLSAAKLRPHEPQSYTYLAKLAEKMGKNDLALIYFEMGLASQWTGRFGDYALIHKVDYANFLRKSLADENVKAFHSKDYAQMKFDGLSKEIDLAGSELIVAISWNTDRTDIDLHVVEPSGEECYYSHNKTRSGGYLTTDVTQGYGPEMYVNKNAPKGKYELLVKYYSSDRNKLGLKTKVLVRTIRNWGTDKESEKIQTIALESKSDKQRIAKIEI